MERRDFISVDTSKLPDPAASPPPRPEDAPTTHYTQRNVNAGEFIPSDAGPWEHDYSYRNSTYYSYAESGGGANMKGKRVLQGGVLALGILAVVGFYFGLRVSGAGPPAPTPGPGPATATARTGECKKAEAAQRWTFNDGALGQLCNGRKLCLSVAAGCDTMSPLMLAPPSFPGELSSCVEQCGCTRSGSRKGQVCNADPKTAGGLHSLDCNTREEFEQSACGLKTGCPITNAIALGALVERADGALVLQGGGKAKPAGDLWVYNGTTKQLRNGRTGKCLGH